MLHWADRLLCSRGHDKGISYSWFKDFILQWVDRATSLRPPASNGLSVHPSRVTWTNLLMEMSIYGRKSRYTKKVPLLICPTQKLQGLTWERLSKINMETYYCAKGMQNFSQFQPQRSQSIHVMPAEKQIIRWYDLLICVSYETYDSRIISNYVWRYCVKLCFHIRSSLSWTAVYVSPSHTAGKSKGFVKELAGNFNKRTMNAI